ncbi:MAG: hypothetical protein K0R59_3207 [Sphingobacterium sp.]|nr:hypothetical protein [Sphingobacterium sp.]
MTFAQFKEEVFALYQAKKIRQELDDQLVNPSPAKLRDYCLIRLSEGLPPEDIEVFQKFFDPLKREKNLEEAITKYNTGYLKALQKFALNITQDPEDRVVKLFAILVDYQPRPFRFNYNNLDHPPLKDAPIEKEHSEAKEDIENASSASSEPQATNYDNVVLEEYQVETIGAADDKNDHMATIEESNEDNEPENMGVLVHSPKKLILNKYALRFSGIASLIIAIFFTVHYLTPEDCMCWNGERYIQVDCQDQTQRYQVIGLDQDKLEHFRKITRPDTLGLKDLGNIWYSKIDNEIEFFTAPGYHPIQTMRSLKATTKHIFETYAGQRTENNQNKQYGIMQKQ